MNADNIGCNYTHETYPICLNDRKCPVCGNCGEHCPGHTGLSDDPKVSQVRIPDPDSQVRGATKLIPARALAWEDMPRKPKRDPWAKFAGMTRKARRAIRFAYKRPPHPQD